MADLNYLFLLCFVLALLTASCVSSRAAAAEPGAPADLAELDSYFEQALQDWQTPGMALAVVADGQVICAKGYGVRNLDSGEPVTADTVFPIGSCTKAFTATLMAMLVDDGKLAWDSPVRLTLPQFELADSWASYHLSLRDIMCHDSGLPRCDAMWVLGSWTPEELLARLKYLPFTAEPRQRWQYTSLLYSVAGCLAQQVTQEDWATLMQQRILGPLGMNETLCFPTLITTAPDHSTGYLVLNGTPGKQAELAPAAISAIPGILAAGGMCSSASDMGKWLIFQLGDGTAGSQRLVSAQNLLTTHTQQIALRVPPLDPQSPMLGYGMGWYISVYRGHYMLQHDGVMNGAQALVTLLPQDGIGVAAMANLVASPVPNIVSMTAIDKLLGLPGQDMNELALAQRDAQNPAAEPAPAAAPEFKPAAAVDFGDSIGIYEHPAYGRISIAATADGSLTAQVNSLPALPLLQDAQVGGQEAAEFSLTVDVASLRMAYARAILGNSPLRFLRGWDGTVSAVEMRLEPSTGAAQFARIN